MNKTWYEEKKKNLCDILQTERCLQLLSQEDIARRTGLRQDVVCKIETGKRRMDVIELIAYCEALNLSLLEVAADIERGFVAKRQVILSRNKANIDDNFKVLYYRRKKHFLDVLRKERTSQSLSLEKLALRMGVNVKVVERMEMGERRIDVIEMIAYCKALNITLTKLAEKITSRFFAVQLLLYQRERSRRV